jgi:hypothetical protein
MSGIRVTELTIYPIKSTAGISLQHTLVEERGFRHDRRWMLVDASNTFITQRRHARMSLIAATVMDDHLRVSAPGMRDKVIPFHESPEEPIAVTVWGDTVNATPAGKSTNAWFSKFLGLPCTLVHMTSQSLRRIDARYAVNSNTVSFADAYPFLLISEASLADLNSRLQSPLPMKRFRPNLVVGGCEPFEEDTWKLIRIGGIDFHVVKPCSRCTITTIDPATAMRGEEPLATLSTYRSRNGKVYFGQNLINDGTGRVSLESEVKILKWK